jgi:signal transduction histidine kinase
MKRIMLLTEPNRNRKLLVEWLAKHYQVVVAEANDALQCPFDLCLIDGPALNRLWEQVQARKKVEEPVLLPVLLLTSRQGVDLVTRHLWRTIDEVVLRPIEKVELQARVEVLLRARQLSVALQRQNEDLRTFIHAMSHDLRAPLRIIDGFVQALGEDHASMLSEQGRRYLGRIHASTAQMLELIASLLAFGSMGRTQLRLRTVDLQAVIARCLQDLEPDIRTSHARVTLTGQLANICANVSLLKMALTNLLANALKFILPGARPYVTIAAAVTPERCRIEVQDQGIGIAPEHHKRIFAPLVRLHGMEEYPGNGLGLAIVAKAVNMMGGRVGVTSAPGQGSTFWIELPHAEVGREVPDHR